MRRLYKAPFKCIVLTVAIAFVIGCSHDPNLRSLKDVREKINSINRNYYSLYYVYPPEKKLDTLIRWRGYSDALLSLNQKNKHELLKDIIFKLEWSRTNQSYQILNQPKNLNLEETLWLKEYNDGMLGYLKRFIRESRLYFEPVIIPIEKKAAYQFKDLQNGFKVESFYYQANSKIESIFNVENLLLKQNSYDLKSGKLILSSDITYVKANGVFHVSKIVKRRSGVNSESDDYTVFSFNYDFSEPIFPLKNIQIRAKRAKNHNPALADDLIEFNIPDHIPDQVLFALKGTG